jgi:hypothetical protein
MHRIRRSAPVQSDEMADDVVVKRFDRQPTAPDPEKTSGVKYYSDLQ